MKSTITVVSYGGGVNSTAMLVEAAKRRLKIDLILFADTGGEKPHTYKYIEMFSKWLVDHGLPEIITVRKAGNNETLEENCLRMNMLPSIAYGFKSCSGKYKIQPQDKYCNNWQPTKDVWKSGSKVVKLIGYDADEHHRAKIPEDKKYIYKYPLLDWDMGREECIESIEKAGLCTPGKSACYFCPSTKSSEIRQLAQVYPDLAERAVKMEGQANLTSVKGLGRNFAWSELLAQDELFDDGYNQTPEMICGCYDG